MTVTAVDGPNVDLLRRTLASVEAHPDALNQRSWRACFGYHAVVTVGGVRPPDERGLLANGMHVGNAAEYVLGLSYAQARQLFRGSNSLEDLRRVVAVVCSGAGS